MSLMNEKSSTTVSYVTKHLRIAILDGSLKDGERLVQSEWAQRLNVSRMPIREALTQLEFEGLVKIVPYKGAVVTPITRENIEELYHTRSLLEGLAVEKSLPHLTDSAKEELGSVLYEMENLILTDETNETYINLNAEFHKILQSGCPWPRLKKTIESLGISPIAPSLLVEYYAETQREHKMIHDAVLRGDPAELRSSVEFHILRTKNNLIAHMEFLNKNNSEEDDSNGV
jgi:DNA-binding GntR family transcriptional regulator